MASDSEGRGPQGAAGSFPCSTCDLTFPSGSLRDSHSARFCIGALTPEAEGARVQGLPHHDGAVQGLPMSLQEMTPVQGGPEGPRAHLEATHARRLAEIGARTRRLEKLREEIGRKLGGLLPMEAPQRRTLPARTTAKEEERGAGLDLWALPATRGPLSAEIRALQVSYLQAGGRDPRVLADMWELHLEAAFLEGSPRQKRERAPGPPRELGRPEEPKQEVGETWRKIERKAPAGPRGLDPQWQALETVNGHLEAEILALQMRRGRRPARQALWGSQPMIGLLQRRGDSAHLPPPVAPPLPPPPPEPPQGTMETIGAPGQSRHLLPPPDVLGPAPYDPGAGFAIFYDFLLGLEAEWSQVQLVTGLARGRQETGPSTALPPSPCLPLPPTPGAPLGSCAILAARQPVPRLHPSLSVTLVAELQAWGLWDGGRDPRPQAWTCLQLFDLEQRVLSGRWKLPLRALPRAPGLHPKQLNAIPQAGRVELYLRIANARDAEIQALAKIDPAQGREYRYLPSVSNSASLDDSNPPSHFLGPPSLLPSLSLSDGFKDPPPAPEEPTSRPDTAAGGPSQLLHKPWGPHL